MKYMTKQRRVVSRFQTFFSAWLLSLTAIPVFAQSGSWTDAFSNALPRILESTTANNPTSFSNNNWGMPNSIPGMFDNGRDWKLGVNIQNTTEGALVVNVAPGSAASQAGIKVGDTIVAVGNRRVGQVDNRVYEIADEFKQQADMSGRLNVLVFDAQTRSMRSLYVNLTSNSSLIRGNVVLADSFVLPNGSTLIVQLKNASNTFKEVSGGTSSRYVQGYGPFPFELNIDPRFVSPNDQYQLIAGIYINQQLAYQQTAPVPISPSSFGQPFNLTLVRSNGGSSISVGYPNSPISTNQIQAMFQQYLGRAPTAPELVAWQTYLQQGNSINALKIGILSGPKYREQFRGNDIAYINDLFFNLRNQTPSQGETQYWLGRFQATGSTAALVQEMAQ